MKGIPFLFMVTGAIFVLIGMLWGIQMSASGNHTLAPAHAHLNLVGWVTFAIWATYYALTPHAAEGTLAKAHYGLALAAVILLVPGIVLAVREMGETLAKLGSVLAVLAMALFIVILVKNGFGRRA